MKSVSADKENAVIQLLSQGLSLRKVAEQVGIGASTVGRIARRSLPDRVRGMAGRPRLLSDTDKRKIMRDILSGNCDTAVQATASLARDAGVVVSTNTVRRVLKESGLHASPKVKKPMLSLRHRKARMEFAIRHKDWTVDDWRKVVWSDETKINRLGSDGREWCWKNPGEALSNRTCKPTVKHGGGSLMVWGCMTAQGAGYLTKIDTIMDADLYCQILCDELVKSLQYHDLDVNDVIFQQDNDPKHTSKKAKACLEELGLEVLQWPAQSPDLNPIEHLWDHLKRCLNAYPTQPKGMLELWERVAVEWDGIQKGVVANLIDSMPRRVAAVLKAKGGMTKY
jgi:transposase